jgi:hypothetical protein
VDNFFHNILRSIKVKTPAIVAKRFIDAFPNSINVEWYYTDKIYEAVFYENDLEKIVRIDKEGNIIDTKVNLPLDILQDSIFKKASIHGEIMNAILISDGSRTFFELIVRDKELRRYLAFFNEEGELLKKNLL